MSNYTPEEVDMLIDMLKSKAPSKSKQPAKQIDRVSGKPFLNKTERTIRYLENRHKFFNPTREMLIYIIGIAENSSLDKSLIAKMKEDLLTKR
ncbi:MAG: hypothetical protein HY361_01140 [Candidatus Aenigmarchaeota archaeon]|nr:hypothetical protein [Candidatus Aenigmarchaeota archaeon]